MLLIIIKYRDIEPFIYKFTELGSIFDHSWKEFIKKVINKKIESINAKENAVLVSISAKKDNIAYRKQTMK